MHFSDNFANLGTLYRLLQTFRHFETVALSLIQFTIERAHSRNFISPADCELEWQF